MTVKKDYVSILKEKFGAIGEVMKSQAEFDRFPVTYHHDYVRQINSNQNKLKEVSSRGDVSMAIREHVPSQEEREEEYIKGAIAYVMHYRSDDILAELLENPVPALIKSYQDMTKFANSLWYNQIKD